MNLDVVTTLVFKQTKLVTERYILFRNLETTVY